MQAVSCCRFPACRALGIGTLGEEARRFVDFLAAAGQTYWQILPLVPPGHGNSPYMSPSAFAGNPFLIDLDELAAEGLLTQQELDSARRDAPRPGGLRLSPRDPDGPAGAGLPALPHPHGDRPGGAPPALDRGVTPQFAALHDQYEAVRTSGRRTPSPTRTGWPSAPSFRTPSTASGST